MALQFPAAVIITVPAAFKNNQIDATNPNCEEASAYPANPDSEYGWEKLYSERLYLSFRKNYGILIMWMGLALSTLSVIPRIRANEK